jgi:hypothetical protein
VQLEGDCYLLSHFLCRSRCPLAALSATRAALFQRQQQGSLGDSPSLLSTAYESLLCSLIVQCLRSCNHQKSVFSLFLRAPGPTHSMFQRICIIAPANGRTNPCKQQHLPSTLWRSLTTTFSCTGRGGWPRLLARLNGLSQLAGVCRLPDLSERVTPVLPSKSTLMPVLGSDALNNS